MPDLGRAEGGAGQGRRRRLRFGCCAITARLTRTSRPAKGVTGMTVCAHAGFGPIRSSQSAGSMVAHVTPDDITVWLTGTSAPCTSVFKPVWFDGGLPEQPRPGKRFDAGTMWWSHEDVAQGHSAQLPRADGGLRRAIVTTWRPASSSMRQPRPTEPPSRRNASRCPTPPNANGCGRCATSPRPTIRACTREPGASGTTWRACHDLRGQAAHARARRAVCLPRPCAVHDRGRDRSGHGQARGVPHLGRRRPASSSTSTSTAGSTTSATGTRMSSRR